MIGGPLTSPVALRLPARDILASYIDALEQGWSPDNSRGEVVAREQLKAIGENPEAFLRSLDDPEAKGPPIILPDGTLAERLPGITHWIWDGDFCGSIGLRWQRGTSALPAHVPGHIGYGIVPWKRGRGYAAKALAALLPLARTKRMDEVRISTSPGNIASQTTILRCGGELIGSIRNIHARGPDDVLLYRISLAQE